MTATLKPGAATASRSSSSSRPSTRRLLGGRVACNICYTMRLVTLLLFAVAAYSQPTAFTIDTFAGGDLLGDGGPATNSQLGQPRDVVVAATGEVFFSDFEQHRVRRIAQDGTISTFAGTGEAGFSGDGGPAAQAMLNFPLGLALDAQGNLYIADQDNQRVRCVTPDGTISTVIGNGTPRLRGDGGAAADAEVNSPGAVAVDDAGNLYIADTNNQRIRKIAGGVVTTIVGSGDTGFGSGGFEGDGGPATQARLNNPRGVAVNTAGDVFVADSDNNRIRRIAADGTISTFAGTGVFGSSGNGGPAVQAELINPNGLAIDGDGNLYFAGRSTNVVRRIRAADGVIEAVAGGGQPGFGGDNGPATLARLDSPSGVGVAPDGSVHIADSSNRRLRRIMSGTITTFAGRTPGGGDGGPATEAPLDVPLGLFASAAGQVFVADVGDHTVRRVATDGTISTIAGTGSSGRSAENAPARQSQLNMPADVVADASGRVFIADTNNARVALVDQAGTLSTFAAGPIQAPAGMALDVAGNLIVADRGAATVWRVDPAGQPTALIGGPAAAQGALADPADVAVGPDGAVYVTDFGARRVFRMSPDGALTTIAGDGGDRLQGVNGPAVAASLPTPQAVEVDANGNVYVADQIAFQVYVIGAGGLLQPIAGNAGEGFSGDSGPALAAMLNRPVGLALGANGAIYIADSQNSRVRRLTPASISINQGGVISAASFAGGAVAPAQIVSIFGVQLASATAAATAQPLPTELAGTRVEVTDSQGVTRRSALFFVAGSQINCEIPPETAIGPARITAFSGSSSASLDITVQGSLPGLFAANARGRGVAAAAAVRIDGVGVQTTIEPVDRSASPFIGRPIDLGPDTDQVVLLLFGTGIRGFQTVEVRVGGEAQQVLGVAPSPEFVGLDQVNVLLSRSLIGRGVVNIELTIDGIVANVVTVTIQ